MSKDNIELVNYWIEKAFRTFETAKHDFKGGFLESSLDRLYYLREEADYTPNPSFEKDEIEILIKETENFLRKMENIIKGMY